MVLPPRVARGTGPVTALTMLRVAGRLTLARGGADGVALIDVESGGLVGHLDPGDAVPVQSLAVVTDERDDWPLLAVGGVDGVVRLWDVARQQPVAETALGSGAVTALAALDGPDGPLLAGATAGQFRVWRWRDARAYDLGHPTEPVTALCAIRLPGSTLLATGDAGGAIRLWDPLAPGAGARILALAHRGSVRALTACTLAGTRLLASGGADRVLRLWRVPPGDAAPLDGPLVEGPPMAGTVRQLVTISRDEGDLLASGCAAGQVELWRPGPHRLVNLRRLPGHAGEIWALAGARDGERAVVASGDVTGEVRLADLRADAAEAATVPLPRGPGCPVWSLAALPGTGLLAAAGADSAVHVVDLDAAAVRHSLAGHRGSVHAVAAGADPAAPTLVTAGADGTIRLWDPVTGRPRAIITSDAGEVWTLATLRWRGRDAVIAAGADGAVRLWRSRRRPETLLAGSGEVTCLAVLPTVDGPLIACGGPTGLRLVPLRRRRRVAYEVSALATVALAPVVLGDRALLACARDEGDVLLLDAATRTVVAALARPETPAQVECLTVLPRAAEAWIVGGCRDGRILIWRAESGALLGTLPGAHIGAVRAIEAAADGTELRSAGDDGRVRRWAVTGVVPRLRNEIRPQVPPGGAVLVSDRPERDDRLGRRDLVAALQDLITDPRTPAPVVLGVHGEWGQGKTSLLLQLRTRLDPVQPAPGWRDPPSPTHELVPREDPSDPAATRSRPGPRTRWRGGPVRTRLTPLWVWRQLRRRPPAAPPYRLRPVTPDGQRVTVWFSPWMYASAAQVWAGLAREISEAVTRRLPTEQRERLWFDLNLRRGDPTGVRRWLRGVLLRALLTGLGAAGLGAAGLALAVAAPGPTPGWFGAALAGVAALLLAPLAAAAGRDLRRALPRQVLDGPAPDGMATPRRAADASDPLRQTDRGQLYLLRHHLREIVELATEDAPIVIFVDDLDRCAAEVVAETIEAINLFVGGAFGPCVFVLAVDPAAVAARIEGTQEELHRRIESDEASFGRLRHLGWRSLEKLIELPIRLPGLTADEVGAYLDELVGPAALGPAPVPTTVPWAEEAPPPARPNRRVPRQRAPVEDLPPLEGPSAPADRPPPVDTLPFPLDALLDAEPAGPPTGTDPPGEGGPPRGRIPAQRRGEPEPPAETPGHVPTVAAAGPAAAAETAAQVDYVERIMEVRRELREAALALPRRSPRQVKCLLNLWRFYMSLEYRSGRLPVRFRDLARHGRAMARFTGIVLRFPRLLDAVSHPSPATFRRLVAAADDDEQWREALAASYLSDLDPAVRQLREVLREPTATDRILVEIAERYL